jgi:hypothetical protein
MTAQRLLQKHPGVIQYSPHGRTVPPKVRSNNLVTPSFSLFSSILVKYLPCPVLMIMPVRLTVGGWLLRQYISSLFQ